jgi:serine/threonine-protein kinase
MQRVGRYEILGELGRGGMGVVYRGRDPVIDRLVAIKVIQLSKLGDPVDIEASRERIYREARSAGRLTHPNVITVYDIGEEGEVAYIAMELVSGCTLERTLSSGEPPSFELIIDVLRQAASALDYAHKKGIVHRDVKPANIMICEDGTVKIADFGIAKVYGSSRTTQTGWVLGTPNYMSPEQIQGKPVDGRADQFCLAVVAFEMLTGQKPFQGEHLATILMKIVSEEPLDPMVLNPRLGRGVAAALRKGLAKDSSARFPDCASFVSGLAAASGEAHEAKPAPHGVESEAVTVSTFAAPAPGPEEVTALTETAPASVEPPAAAPVPAGGSRRRLVAGAAAAACVIVAAGGVAVWRAGSSEPGRPAAARVEETRPAPPAPTSDASLASTPAPPEKPAAPATEPAGPKTLPPPVPAVPAKQTPQTGQVHIVTAPPGAQISLTGDPEKSCRTPCSLELARGRHTVTAALEGYHTELRILEVTGDAQELFVSLPQMAGRLRVETDPPGAAILIDGKQQAEVTPATITLPVGSYELVVAKDGKRVTEKIDVKSGALLKYTLSLP